MSFATTLVLGVTAMMQQAPDPSREVRIPFTLVEGRPVVEVMIGSESAVPFILDTGASATVLNADLVAEIGLAAEGNVLLADPSGGEGTPGQTHRLPSLSIGGWVFMDVFAVSWSDPAMTAGLGGPRGVLGAASLAGVSLEFDFPGLELVISSARLEENDGSIPYSDVQSVIPSIHLAVADTVLDAHIDTGNGRGIGLPKSLRDRLHFLGETRTDTARSASGAFPIETGQLADPVGVGEVEVHQPLVFLNERFPNGNVGTPALMDLRLTLDVGRRRLRIARR
jgi:hypothetical protein